MPEEYTGGLGANGAAALKDFTKSGGTLLFFNHSSEYAIEQLGVPAKNVLAEPPIKTFIRLVLC